MYSPDSYRITRLTLQNHKWKSWIYYHPYRKGSMALADQMRNGLGFVKSESLLKYLWVCFPSDGQHFKKLDHGEAWKDLDAYTKFFYNEPGLLEPNIAIKTGSHNIFSPSWLFAVVHK